MEEFSQEVALKFPLGIRSRFRANFGLGLCFFCFVFLSLFLFLFKTCWDPLTKRRIIALLCLIVSVPCLLLYFLKHRITQQQKKREKILCVYFIDLKNLFIGALWRWPHKKSWQIIKKWASVPYRLFSSRTNWCSEIEVVWGEIKDSIPTLSLLHLGKDS